MIIVKGREMLIPNNERYIGTVYDNQSENRQILIPRFSERGVDLANLTFRMDLEYPNEGKDTVLLDREVSDETILLTWEITESQVQQTGTIFAQIRAGDDNVDVRWSTFRAAFYNEAHINTPSTYTGDLTELEQLEAKVSAVLNSEEQRQENEIARQEAEEGRAEAEEQREADFDAAIEEFNREKSDLYDYMVMSKSWAVGDTGAREGEDTNNSKYWAQRSNASAEAAAISAGVAESYADIVIPTFYVDFNTMELMQNETSDRLVFSLSEDKNLMLDIL